MESTVSKDFMDALRAGYSHFYVHTVEVDRAIKYMSDLLEETNRFKLGTWSIASNPKDPSGLPPLQELDGKEPYSVLFLKNFHWLLDPRSPLGNMALDITQYLLEKSVDWRSSRNRKIAVVVSPKHPRDALPMELRQLFHTLRFERPCPAEMEPIYDKMVRSAQNAKIDLSYSDEEKARILECARGMSYQEIEDAFSKSIVATGSLNTGVITNIKSEMLEGIAGVRLLDTTRSYDDIVGYDLFKEFLGGRDYPDGVIGHPDAKGVLVVGPPGCGKSVLGEALAHETGLPVLDVEFAELFGSLVGETYERMQALLDVLRAYGKCIVRVDEIEKGMKGVSGDGGVSSNEITVRAMSMWLKFMSEPRECFIYGTCNDITAFAGAPEYLRAGRWDTAPWYVGLPNVKEKDAILAHYKEKHGVDGNPGTMVDWSGAEVERACILASMMGRPLEKVVHLIRPIGRIMPKAIEELESWAKTNALPASSEVKLDLDDADRDIAVESRKGKKRSKK